MRMRRKRRDRVPEPTTGLGLLDEAFHLLRTTPVQAFLPYFVGTLPFLAFALFFWGDMSRSAFAAERCALLSLALALLYVWMKTWQSIFMTRLRARLSPSDREPWTWRRFLTTAYLQTVIHATAAPVLAVASLIFLPSGWAIAFYESAVLLGNGRSSSIRETVRASQRQAALWPRQNHLALLVLSLFGLFVALDILIALAAIPQILRVFVGIDTVFTQGMAAYFNTTLLAGVLALTYLAVDPFFKAAYALRCFYGESLVTGEDLLADLSVARNARKAAGLGLVLFLALGSAAAAQHDDVAGDGVSAPAMEEAVARTLRSSRYSWRMPRERPMDDDQGVIKRFFSSLAEEVGDLIQEAAILLRRFENWLDGVLGRRRGHAGGGGGGGFRALARPLVIGLTIVVMAALCAYAYRAWRRGRRLRVQDAEPVAAGEPDLQDEGVTADLLESEDWLAMARDLMARGEYRLGARAAYLACLACLADHDVLTIARHKSNWEYVNELRRRGHALPVAVHAFEGVVYDFDRVWYGQHPLEREGLNAFLGQVEGVRTGLE